MQHELKLGLEKKAGVKELEQVIQEKASLVMTSELVKRVNKLEEAVLKAGAGGFGAPPVIPKGKKGAIAHKEKYNDGDLSELQEEDEDEDRSETAT